MRCTTLYQVDHIFIIAVFQLRMAAVNLYAAFLTNNQHPLQKITDSLLQSHLLLLLSTRLRPAVMARNKIHLHGWLRCPNRLMPLHLDHFHHWLKIDEVWDEGDTFAKYSFCDVILRGLDMKIAAGWIWSQLLPQIQSLIHRLMFLIGFLHPSDDRAQHKEVPIWYSISFSF